MNNDTFGNLARMIKEGFDKTATKEDIAEIIKDIGQLDDRLNHIETIGG